MRAAWSFLTAFGGSTPPAPGVTRWFPLAGLLIGLVVGGVWWGASLLFPPLLAAAVAVVADLVVTGMLHMDGVADVADGCLSTVPAARRRAIMSSPDVGAFGVVTVVATLLLRFGALAGFGPSPLVVAGIWCLSRTIMAVVPTMMTYVGGGLATAFVDSRSGTVLTGAGGLAAAAAMVWAGRGLPVGGWVLEPVGSGASYDLAMVASAGITALLCIAVGCAAAAAVVTLARRRLGGYTGDVLGAAGVMAETASLLVMAASL